MGEASIWTKTQLAVFFVVLLLAVDEINPIKIVLQVFPSLLPWHIAALSATFMVSIFISDVKALLYFGIKVFFHSVLSIFFRSVEVVGRENIPHYGPVIFTINHQNQFIDAVCVVCTSKRTVSYLMAEASWRRRIVGDLAWALGVVPVRRAQDDAKPGSGTIRFLGKRPEKMGGDGADDDVPRLITLKGFGTKFGQELAVGDKIRPPGTAFGLKVKSIESDTSMLVDGSHLPTDFPMHLFDGDDDKQTTEPVTYDLLKHTPLTTVFEKVLERLSGGHAVGIFPEGGSHDRTDLLPLKVGISLISYSALEKDGLNVPIVPVGLSYFRAHRWRGRAVVEYGRPIFIDPATLDDFKAGGSRRRKVCNDFLEDVETSMRSVIVSAPDYDTLELIHTARRLYQKNGSSIDISRKQDLSRRFVEGYRRLLLMTEGGDVPKEWLDLQERIKDYRNELKDLGLKDYQVPALKEEHLDEAPDIEKVDGDRVVLTLQLFYNIVHKSILIAVSAVPILLLNLPVGVMAGLYSERRRLQALQKSKVKIKAYDVMLTEKVLFCIVMVPTLWFLYGLGLYLGTNLDGPTIAVILISFPIFAYTGIAVTEFGIVQFSDLKPNLMRLFPSSRKRLAALPDKRKKLRDDLRAYIKTIGPSLGEIYYGKDLDWGKIQEQTKTSLMEDTKKTT